MRRRKRIIFFMLLFLKFEVLFYLGNISVNTTLNPKSAGCPIIGILGPTPSETACLPNLVTPVTSGIKNPVVVLVSQLKVISALTEMPAPLFQFFAKKG